MRAPRHVAALAFGLAFVPALIASRACLADDTPLAERQQQTNDTLAKLDSKLVPTREQFVAGSLSFAVYHELGHFLIDEFDIPVLGGREEDMADAYAVFELGPHAAKEQMQSAVRLWLYLAFMRGATPIVWWDTHSLDAQRAFQISCFLSGRWPETYAGLPEAFGAPAQRAGHCVAEAYRTQAAWVETLRAESATVIHKQQATSPPAGAGRAERRREVAEGKRPARGSRSKSAGIDCPTGGSKNNSNRQGASRAREDTERPRVEVVGRSCGVATHSMSGEKRSRAAAHSPAKAPSPRRTPSRRVRRPDPAGRQHGERALPE